MYPTMRTRWPSSFRALGDRSGRDEVGDGEGDVAHPHRAKDRIRKRLGMTESLRGFSAFSRYRLANIPFQFPRFDDRQRNAAAGFGCHGEPLRINEGV